MKKRLFCMFLLFVAVLTGLTLRITWQDRESTREAQTAAILLTNDMEQQLAQGDAQAAGASAAQLRQELVRMEPAAPDHSRAWLLWGAALCTLAVAFGYLYVAVLRPFDKLKDFASRLAQGDFDVPLRYQRANYFGDFTWAFDNMRREITKARSGEREAIENNKTVIATLSHDIKTPVSSIRAYAEGLEANMDTTPERRSRYLSVIMRKCDQVSQLTDDLFLHALSDLEKLKIRRERLELSSLVGQAAEELSDQGDVIYQGAVSPMYVMGDPERITQILENLINNARKYANPPILVSLDQQVGMAQLHVWDRGGGIPDADMPSVFEKFYRGKNCGTAQGSGLGLYIVRYLTEKMGGRVLLHNHPEGLEALVQLPLLRQQRSEHA